MSKDATKTELPKTTEKAASAILDRLAGGPSEHAVETSGIPALDGALNDPKAAEAIKSVTAASVVTGAAVGGVAGFVAGFAAGAGLLGLTWVLWPKKRGSK